MTVRSFQDVDLWACATIRSASSERTVSAEELRAEDAAWNARRYHRARLVAEAEGGAVVGWGQVHHLPWHFHPDKYGLWLQIHPEWRNRGFGSRLFKGLLTELRGREALLTRAEVMDDDPATIAFLTHRGFAEVWRYLESSLDVTTFDPAPFAECEEQAARQGLTITTLADEAASNPEVLREVYAVDLGSQDQREVDAVTPPSFEEFAASAVEGPHALPEAWFLGRIEGRLVGMSTLERLSGAPERLESGFTAVHLEFRRRGIARALKLRTIRYAREHGYRSIETNSNAGNAPMLRLNAELGFQPRPARMLYELRLREETEP